MAKIAAKSLVLICANIALAAICAPAFSDAPSTDPGAAKPKSAPSSHSWPTRVVGVMVGAVVGTPVCVIRKSIDEEKYGIQGMVGDTDSKLKKFAAGVFWLPFSVLTGPAESPVCSAVNALRENEKPFSKSQFSISDCKKDNPKDNGN